MFRKDQKLHPDIPSNTKHALIKKKNPKQQTFSQHSLTKQTNNQQTKQEAKQQSSEVSILKHICVSCIFSWSMCCTHVASEEHCFAGI